MEGQVLLIHGRQGSWFVRKTALDAVTVGDRSFAVDSILEDRAWQVYEEPDPITLIPYEALTAHNARGKHLVVDTLISTHTI